MLSMMGKKLNLMSFKQIQILIFATFFIFVAGGCGKSDSEKKLEQRTSEVQRKEQQLQSLEKQLRIKEQQLTLQQQRIDSLTIQNDTLGIYNPQLIGEWRVTMQCIETTCEGSAIGDTKTEQWKIAYNENKVVVNATANKKLIRVYEGLYKINSLELATPPVPNAETTMNVVLNPHPTTKNLMEGQRVITQANNCRIVYSLKAERL